jgi:membrane protein
MKKLLAALVLVVHIGTFAATSTNAFQDAQNAAANDPETKKILENNSYLNTGDQGFGLGDAVNIGGGIAGAAALGNALRGVNVGKGSTFPGLDPFKTDTGVTPPFWDLGAAKLKPWQYALIAIFMARELREIFSGFSGTQTKLKNPEFASSPLGQMKDTSDPRAAVIIAGFKIVGSITQKIGKTVSQFMSAFLLALSLLELMIAYFKEITGMVQGDKTLLGIIMKSIPQVITTSFMLMLLANGFFWNFYTGTLFGVSLQVAGLLTGQNFQMNLLPDYLTKMMNVPFAIIFAGIKMTFSARYMFNSIMPFLTIVSGLILMFLTVKSAVEVMTILIEYLLVGIFSMGVMPFIALGVTKNFGTGIISGVMAAMANVIAAFTFFGLVFGLVDTISTHGGKMDANKILSLIFMMFIVNTLLMNAKTVGSSVNSGSTAYIQASSVINEVIGAGFAVMGVGNLIANFKNMGVEKIAEKEMEKRVEELGGNLSKNEQAALYKEVVKDVKANVSMKDQFRVGMESLRREGFGSYQKVLSANQQKLQLTQKDVTDIVNGNYGSERFENFVNKVKNNTRDEKEGKEKLAKRKQQQPLDIPLTAVDRGAKTPVTDPGNPMPKSDAEQAQEMLNELENDLGFNNGNAAGSSEGSDWNEDFDLS